MFSSLSESQFNSLAVYLTGLKVSESLLSIHLNIGLMLVQMDHAMGEV